MAIRGHGPEAAMARDVDYRRLRPKGSNTMRSITSLLAVAASLFVSSTALASPEVRDHRDTTSRVADRDHHHHHSTRTHKRYRKRPGPRFMFPLKVDLGAAGMQTAHGFAPGFGGSIGIHWASLSPKPTDTDVGIGVFGAVLAAPETTATTAMMEESGAAYGGAYLEVGQTLSRGSFWRTWASARGEYLGSTAYGESHAGFGATGRLSAEVYVSGVGIEPRGMFLGTYAIGLYVEAGVRDTAPDLGAFHMSGGLTFRTPLVFTTR